ncbi:IPT/TIG domain-containing protein [Ekhidna sp. To15]|uniref:IPT/TIG domain-containing protein n=1 Tax=Ekhidna sp. To15 TaxID=3395267 RepID=UPI003F51DB97
MKIIFRNIFFVSLLALLVKCDEEDITSRNYPRLRTLSVSEITADGARFNAEIIFRGEFEIINFGFVWSENESPTIESSDRVIYSENIQSEKFSETIETTLKEGVSYFVRAFVETNDFIVYGENISFVSLGSLAPNIVEVTPTDIFYLDTIEIKGRGFSYLISQNEVKLGEAIAPIVALSDTVIKITVPNSIEDANPVVKVSTQGNIAEYDIPLNFISPKIKSVSKKQLVYGDTVQIVGSYFGLDKTLTNISINGVKLDPIVADSNLIKLIIPVVPQNFSISIKNSVDQEVLSESLEILSPIINDISPESAYYNDEVILSGANFSFLSEVIEIFFNETSATVRTSDNNEIIAEVPEGVKNPITVKLQVADLESNIHDFYYLGPEIEFISPSQGTWGTEVTITGNNFSNNPNDIDVKIGGVQAEVTASSTDELTIVIPEELGSVSSQLEIQIGKGYDITEQTFTLELPVYSSISTNLTSDINALITINGDYFNPNSSLNTVSYNGSNLDIVSSSKNSIQVRINESVLDNALVTEEIIRPLNYSNSIGSFNTDELTLQYDAPWSLLENLNFGWWSESFQIGSKGYIITHSRALYEFDFNTEEWTQLTSFPGAGGFNDNNRYHGTGFVLNGKIYYGTGYVRGGSGNPNLVSPPVLKKDFWVFDPSVNSWAQLNDIPDVEKNIYDGISFNEKGFLISNSVYEYDHLSDSWTPKSSLSDNEIDDGSYFSPKSYIVSGILYCVYYDLDIGQTVFSHYDEVGDTWTIDYTTSSLNRINDVMILDNKVYLIDMIVQSYNSVYDFGAPFRFIPYPNSFTTTLMEYNPITNNLIEITDPEDRIGLIPFAFNGLLFGDGLTFGHQFYKYDPNF